MSRPDPPELFPGVKRYPGWRPYCLVCDTMQRMEAREYGWQCVACHNKITHELTHYTPPVAALGVLAGPDRWHLNAQ